MIDIHTHVLPFVDDGSETLESSIDMIKTAVAHGVTDMILTPHFRAPFLMAKEKLQENFSAFKEEVKSRGIDVNLYLGQEIRITDKFNELFQKEKVITINGSKFVLVEFSFGRPKDIAEIVYELVRLGYIPIVAHLERYFYVDVSTALDIKRAGGLIQVNSSSIIGKNGFKIKRKVKRFFLRGLVDFVASDIHENRKYYMENAYKKIAKKFGEDVAENVFNLNAKILTKG